MSSTIRPAAQVNVGKFLLWMGIAFALLVLDQWSKWYVAKIFDPGQVLPVFPGFNLVLAFNRGAAFSFLAQAGGWQVWFFGILAAIVIVVMLRLLWRYSTYNLFSLSLAFIVSGAAGNLIDRVMRGYVIDFLDFYVNGMHWPAFNVADTVICIGAEFLVLDEIRGVRTRGTSARKRK